jgi:putative tryptophan/tyrosine transport system substrate-binding protein
MDRRAFIVGGVAALAAPLAAHVQQAERVARIGMLGPSPGNPLVEAFKQGLRELGYVEGQNIRIEHRWTQGRNELLSGLAADLVRLKVDVIVASIQGAVAAKQATIASPIVMPTITDPVTRSRREPRQTGRECHRVRNPESGIARKMVGTGLRKPCQKLLG